MRVFHNSLNVAGETRSDARVASEGPRATMKKTPPLDVGRGPVPRHRSRARPVGQDRQILTRSGSGEPELQRWARCALPSRVDKFMKHPHFIIPELRENVQFLSMFDFLFGNMV